MKNVYDIENTCLYFNCNKESSRHFLKKKFGNGKTPKISTKHPVAYSSLRNRRRAGNKRRAWKIWQEE